MAIRNENRRQTVSRSAWLEGGRTLRGVDRYWDTAVCDSFEDRWDKPSPSRRAQGAESVPSLAWLEEFAGVVSC